MKDPVITPDIGKPPSSDTDSLSAPKAINIAAASPSAAYKENTVVRGIFSKTKFFGLSHWMNSIYQVRNNVLPATQIQEMNTHYH